MLLILHCMRQWFGEDGGAESLVAVVVSTELVVGLLWASSILVSVKRTVQQQQQY
jgi:hypothetical protein